MTSSTYLDTLTPAPRPLTPALGWLLSSQPTSLPVTFLHNLLCLHFCSGNPPVYRSSLILALLSAGGPPSSWHPAEPPLCPTLQPPPVGILHTDLFRDGACVCLPAFEAASEAGAVSFTRLNPLLLLAQVAVVDVLPGKWPGFGVRISGWSWRGCP